MSLIDRLIEPINDYISFRDFIFHLSSANHEPLYEVVTYLLHHDLDTLDFYNIDTSYKIIKFAPDEFDTVTEFLKEIQKALSFSHEEWVWVGKESLDELRDQDRRALTDAVSKAMQCFFLKSDVLGFEPLNGLLHFESEERENPIDKRIEENDRKYILVTKYVNDLGKGKSIGSGKPLKITVEYILENIPLNEVDLYKLKGTNYLLVSQASEFKYKSATDILRSVYDVLDDEQTGTVSSDREPFEGFYFKYSQVPDLSSIVSKTVAKKQMIYLDKLSSTNSPKSLVNSSMINSLGENQRLLTTYALFTPEDLTCLLIDENPACISHNDNYLRHHHMVSNAIDAKLLTLNNEGKILAEQAKTWLASHGFVYKGFNDNLMDVTHSPNKESVAYQNRIAELEQQLADKKAEDRFGMGSPTVEQGEPKDSEQIISDFREQITQLTAENEKLNKQLNNAHSAIEAAKTSQPNDDGKELAPNSEAKVANLIYTLLNELKYDLTMGGKGNTNLLIENTSKNLHTPLSPNFIAYWLKKAYQLQIKYLNN